MLKAVVRSMVLLVFCFVSSLLSSIILGIRVTDQFISGSLLILLPSPLFNHDFPFVSLFFSYLYRWPGRCLCTPCLKSLTFELLSPYIPYSYPIVSPFSCFLSLSASSFGFFSFCFDFTIGHAVLQSGSTGYIVQSLQSPLCSCNVICAFDSGTFSV